MSGIRRTRIRENIEYVEPDRHRNISCCSGMIVSSSPKIFIDTNMGAEDSRKLLASEKPEIAVLSHYHVDHSAWAASALELTHARLFVPEGEADRLVSLDAYVERTAAFPELKSAWKAITQKIAGYQAVSDFSVHNGNTRFRSGDTTIECVRSPGHSPAHTCFYLPGERLLFAGDMGVGHLGPWYGSRDSDLRQFVESILSLRSLKVEGLLTCHDGMITSNIEQAWQRCLISILERESMIRQKLDLGKTKGEIVEQGICFHHKNGLRRRFLDFIRMWDSVMFDQHRAILDEGSLSKLFPELKRLKKT